MPRSLPPAAGWHFDKAAIPQALRSALEHHRAGRLLQAEIIYRQVLQLEPHHADALHLTGMLAYQRGHHAAAAAWISQAIKADPSCPSYYSNLGLVLRALGRLDEAVENYHKALSLNPDYAEAHNNLGNALKELGESHAAVESYQRALLIKPSYAEAHYNLGNAFRDQGKLDASIDSYYRALSLLPYYAEAYNNVGVVLNDQGKLDAAVENYQKALSIKPDYAEALCNLGDALRDQGKIDAAADSYWQSILVKPDYAKAYTNLGSLLADRGRPDEAQKVFQKGLLLNPSCARLYSSMIFALSRAEADNNALLFALSKQFGEHFEAGLVRLPHENQPIPDKRLKIGYVSGDFRQHSVAHFIEPILANHDRQNVEVFCYYNYHKIDHVTWRLMGLPDHWRSIVAMPDEQVAEIIRRDGIDILVDLAGHTARNRLLTFARKPAPVQVTWIGYPGTTGLTAMDYRLTNQYVESGGWNEQFHTETLIRLPVSTCFLPDQCLPPVNALPALSHGFITFASFHVSNKITAATLSLWAKVLQAVPTSRLLLCLDTSKERVTEAFLALGVQPERLSFVARLPLQQYLALHHEVDIMLDTFPYTGGTISRNALWMGVPILTLAGKAPRSRIGLALQTQIGLEAFVAECEDDYIDNARRWAGDLAGLSGVRMSLREKMQAAPFSNGALVARAVESAYRKMWMAWCESQAGQR